MKDEHIAKIAAKFGFSMVQVKNADTSPEIRLALEVICSKVSTAFKDAINMLADDSETGPFIAPAIVGSVANHVSSTARALPDHMRLVYLKFIAFTVEQLIIEEEERKGEK